MNAQEFSPRISKSPKYVSSETTPPTKNQTFISHCLTTIIAVELEPLHQATNMSNGLLKSFQVLTSYEIFCPTVAIKLALIFHRESDLLVISRKRLDCFGYRKAVLQNIFPFAFIYKTAVQLYSKILDILYSDILFCLLD